MIKELQESSLGQRPSWDEYFMLMAIVSGTRSSCRHVRAGSIIVDPKNQVLGAGYNGAPSQYENCLDVGCRKEAKGLVYGESLDSGECVGIHSEMNAVGHLTKIDERKKTLYTTVFPCHGCAKNLLPYNLGRVVFRSVYDEGDMEKALARFEGARVPVDRLNLSPERVVDILFAQPEVDFDIFSSEEKDRIRVKY